MAGRFRTFVRIAYRSRPWRNVFPMALLAGGIVATALIISSCRPEPSTLPIAPLSPGSPIRLAPPGVPAIRVRLGSAVQTLNLSTTGPYRIRVDGRDIAGDSRAMPPTRARRLSGGVWQFNNVTALGEKAEIVALEESFVRLDQTCYRGLIRLVPENPDGFFAVNQVDLENYLAGVLSRELLNGWSLETYRALAVAARTFAEYQMATQGKTREWDVGSDQSSQVYGGAAAETPKAWAAVRGTKGVVLGYGPAGREQILFAQYSSCCGGHVNGAFVLRDCDLSEPYRGGQSCDDCRASQRYRWPAVSISKSVLLSALAASCGDEFADMTRLREIRTVSTTDYGRPVWLDIVGVNGQSVRLRAEDLRLALFRQGLTGGKGGLYSMNCRIRDAGDRVEFTDGRGFGHGVGLCQWGAEGKARRGWRAEQILAFYYPGARLYRAY